MRAPGFGIVAVLAILVAAPARAQLPLPPVPSVTAPLPTVTPVPVPSIPVPSVPAPSLPTPMPSLPAPSVPVPSVPSGASLLPPAPGGSGSGATGSTGGSGSEQGTAVGRGTGTAPAARAGGSDRGGSSSGGTDSAPGQAGSGRTDGTSGPASSERRAGRRAIRVRDRRLRQLVQRHSGCLHDLPSRQRRVLRLRAGVGRAQPASRTRVARRLDLPVAAVRRAERRGLRALHRAGRNGCAQVGAAGPPTPTDATAVLTGGGELVTARGDLPGGGSQGADAKGGGTATDGGAVRNGASGGGARGGVAGISATRSAPESAALNHIAPLLLLVLLALAAVAVAASRAHSHKDGFFVGRWFAALLPAGAATATPPEERPRTVPVTTPARTLPPPAAAPVRDRVPPPDARRSWIAEVQWRESRFTVVARAGDDEPSVALAASAQLRWPPADAGAAREMRSAVEGLGEALLATGWRPLPDGSAWYAKRFAWTAESPDRSFVPQKEWPAGTEDLWRCEIAWRSGYRNSCFRVVAHGPARTPGGTIALSRTYKWLFKNDPEADTRSVADVRRLAERLIGAGWEPVGRGRRWYELRFVWRREGAPSDNLTPAR